MSRVARDTYWREVGEWRSLPTVGRDTAAMTMECGALLKTDDSYKVLVILQQQWIRMKDNDVGRGGMGE